LEQCDWLCSNVAAKTGAVVVSVAYRTAPAHRWPTAPEDCYAALLDVVARTSELGVDPARITVMGDSAGGNLAAVVTLMARDRSGPSIARQILLYPVTDLTDASTSLRHGSKTPVVTSADMLASRQHYLGQQDPSDPYASPLMAEDLAGLPPALIQVAEFDPLREDGLRYARALRRAAVDVRVTEYIGMPHGYFIFPKFCSCTAQALAEVCAAVTGDW
jgi:acetyl esterase